MTVLPVTGLVLAGGASRRMGVDKAQLTIGGRSLLERAVAALEPWCVEVLVASGDGQRLVGPWRQVRDAQTDAGPLSALVAGLEAAATPVVAVLGVDLPHPSTDLFAALVDRWRAGVSAVVPCSDGRLQPLHAVYATSVAVRMRQLLETGERSLTRCVTDQADVIVLDEHEAAQAARGTAFATNVNTPAEAEAAGVDLH